ncbi:MAG TPA: ATP-binding cassette domain-containing protein [Humisphaera sp.]
MNTPDPASADETAAPHPRPAARPGGASMLRFDDLFAVVNPIVIGRDAECTVHLPHPTVSTYHAILERQPDGGLIVQDLESAAGTFVNGRRVRTPTLVYEGDRVGIGPYLFTRRGPGLATLDSSRSLRLEARNLTREVKAHGGGRRKILDDVSLVVRPGEFVTLLGPSGSGKSTLMDCLNGRRRATAGKVLANGQDFYEQFDAFRQSLGYVPQKDIVHTALTVRRALYYTARLRLPMDTHPDEIRSRVDDVVRQMELGPHQDTLVGNLSGGQIKRVSLGAELLARPPLLYIDEATSGLDAGTEARMMRLFRQLADEGKSIVCITHALENVDQCHLVLVLAAGRLMYYGPPAEAPEHFGVRTLSQVYDRLGERDVAEWHERFRRSHHYKAYVEDRLAEGEAFAAAAEAAEAEAAAAGTDGAGRTDSPLTLTTETTAIPHRPAAPVLTTAAHGSATAPQPRPLRSRGRSRRRKVRRFLAPVRLAAHQFRVLTLRYVELTVRDPRSLRLLLLQAPIVALFLLIGFTNKKYEDTLPKTREISAREAEVLSQANAWRLVLARDAKPDPALAAEPLVPTTRPATTAPATRATTQPSGNPHREQLEKLHFTVTAAGQDWNLNGWDLHLLAQEAHDRRLTVERRADINKWNVKLVNGQPPSTVSGTDLLAAAEQVGESRMFDAVVRAAAEKKPIVIEQIIVDPKFTFMLLNILAITVFWFGCNNAAKEIVKEQSVYGRERAVNLRIFPYLASKFAVLGVMSAGQAVGLAGTVFGVLWLLHGKPYLQHYPPDLYKLPLVNLMGVFALLSLVGAAAGLLISACAANPDRANALLPYVLIPQIILGGAIIPIKGEPISTLAQTLCPVYWAFRASQRGSSELPLWHPLYAATDYSVEWACLALGIQLVVALLLTAGFLRLADLTKR